MDIERLKRTAKEMVSKGILAMDESTGTATKRLEGVGVESTEENRRRYRQLLVTAKGLGQYVSGAILYEETIRQKAQDEKTMVEHLQSQGIVPGIKVDRGAKEMALFPDEKITEGLDGLRDRLKEYRELGARFAKWRAVIEIGENMPTQQCIDANAHALARYAALCQEQGIVPIVEPEVIMKGTHTLETSYEVTDRVLRAVFDALREMKIALEGIVLKPNMVLSGLDAEERDSSEKVAEMTYKVLKENIPHEVPGIAFLSGGMSDEESTENLRVLNEMYCGEAPWRLTFSYGRGLQREPLNIWSGDDSKVPEAQAALVRRAKENYLASQGGNE